jgi:hypothetical protein
VIARASIPRCSDQSAAEFPETENPHLQGFLSHMRRRGLEPPITHAAKIVATRDVLSGGRGLVRARADGAGQRLGLSVVEIDSEPDGVARRWDDSGVLIEPPSAGRRTNVITGHPGGTARPLPMVPAARRARRPSGSARGRSGSSRGRAAARQNGV